MGSTKYNEQINVLAVKMVLEDEKKINKSVKELGISYSMLVRWFMNMKLMVKIRLFLIMVIKYLIKILKLKS